MRSPLRGPGRSRSPFGDQVAIAFTVAFTGLTGGVAEAGTHASIGYTINPDNGTETVKWSNSSNSADAATYGTGAAPTDFAAGVGGALYLHVTDGGETVTRSASIVAASADAGLLESGDTILLESGDRLLLE